MIGYNCKYAPVELLAGFDLKCERIDGNVENFDYANSRLHVNMCSHAKAMLEKIHGGGYSGLLFMDCCDSARRVFDAAQAEGLTFCHRMDLPSCGGRCAVEKLRDDLLALISSLERQYAQPFNVQKFLSAFTDAASIPDQPFVAILGARCDQNLPAVMHSCMEAEIADFTCASSRAVPVPEVDAGDSLADIMQKYASALLSQTPCMRMQEPRRIEAVIENENCKGIVYNAVKFCDYYDFEFSKLGQLSIPMIRVETDFTNQSYGQLLTRLEGFGETVQKIKTGGKAGNMSGKYFVGIDSGSTSTELVALDRDRNVVKSVMVKTGANAGAGADKALAQAGLDKTDIAYIVATGYGRKNIAYADADVTEITCHARGAKHLYPDVRTIIDIGGQDSKVITLDESGKVTNFIMNDKCAAGTGRFLENMAKVLELSLDDMAAVGMKYKNDLTISSMCTVFAESEVVSLIAENHSVADIVHGLNKSVATKTKSMCGRVKDTDHMMMTGGVANNAGVVSELEKQLKTKIFIPEQPEFCGALGAALIAAEAAQD